MRTLLKPKLLLFLALALLITLLSVCCCPVMTPLRARLNLRSTAGRIAFLSKRDVYWEICVMNADGSGQTRLAEISQNFVVPPFWSPDGTRIAFLSWRYDSGAHSEIYVVYADRSGLTRLTNDPAEEWPVWSPDSTRIAFDSYTWATRDEGAEIYVVNADGSGLTNLTNNAVSGLLFVWSPDSTRVAFVSERDGNREIYVVGVPDGADADGSGLTNLTNNPASDGNPVWSPDGTRIAFVSERDSNDEIYVMNADGSGQTRLTETSGGEKSVYPGWSPDGTRIAFTSGGSEIYVMAVPDGTDADGSEVTHLAAGEDPSWSPDGTRILFTSQRGGSCRIYVVNADGNEPEVTHLADGGGASWSSDGTRILYTARLFYPMSALAQFFDDEIYVMNADGSGQTNLTNSPLVGDVNPVWQP